ncbi:uncharacterized protein BXZ73DRAFT_52610 [Epithele typhae]|uniref:uncharacterized protein n=1 Tax=Epithele typhae TaxID=378194 RepID=UPI0020080049|nr:uncharacterized protein BXZ73DRAFT_52610 [Epithele typhae]KAH9919170.1 hypothetical protein BXZ73DRAFT_52610 [Epithele typhae]
MQNNNIDRAIASVVERGQEIIVPNVFAAYLQCMLGYDYDVLDPTSAIEMDAIAQTALISFEHAMDKYPMPARSAKSRGQTKTKTSSAPTLSSISVAPRIYSAQVAQLRQEYQQSLVRVMSVRDENGYDYDYAYRGCTCVSCTSLATSRERAALDLSLDSEEGEQAEMVPVRKRKARKVKKSTKKKTLKTRDLPFDPFAPSTSTAAA